MPKTLRRKLRKKLKRTTQKPKFDPEGVGYDMKSALAAGLKPIEGHWQSRIPKTGLLLKGRGHKTWALTVKGEKEAGYIIYKGKGGRYYSKPGKKLKRLKAIRKTIPSYFGITGKF